MAAGGLQQAEAASHKFVAPPFYGTLPLAGCMLLVRVNVRALVNPRTSEKHHAVIYKNVTFNSL